MSVILNENRGSGFFHFNGKYFLVISAILVATWPTVVWYQARMKDGSDNNWGLFSLGIALLISVSKFQFEVPRVKLKHQFIQINVLLLIYLLSMILSFYPIIQAAIVAVLYGSILSRLNGKNKINPGIVGLMFLGLPLFASLDFYGGYPLRYFIGVVSSSILNLQGAGVRLEGINLFFGNKIILIDGPCSGIKMMWTGSLLVFSIVAYYELRVRQSIVLGLIAVTSILCANILRVCALFYIEAGYSSSPKWMHEAVGLTCYFVAIVVILYFGLKQIDIKRRSNLVEQD